MLRSAAHCRRLSCATMAAGSQCIETIANETTGSTGGLQCVCWGGGGGHSVPHRSTTASRSCGIGESSRDGAVDSDFVRVKRRYHNIRPRERERECDPNGFVLERQEAQEEQI